MISMGGTETKKKGFIGLIPGVPHSGTEPVGNKKKLIKHFLN